MDMGTGFFWTSSIHASTPFASKVGPTPCSMLTDERSLMISDHSCSMGGNLIVTFGATLSLGLTPLILTAVLTAASRTGPVLTEALYISLLIVSHCWLSNIMVCP